MPAIVEKGREKDEAKILIEFASAEAELDPENLIKLIKDVITNKDSSKAEYWSWKVIDYIEQKTGAVRIDYDADVDTEIGDWGLPVITGGVRPLGVTIVNKTYLMKLLEYLEEEVNDTFGRIGEYFVRNDRTNNQVKWVCQSCGRYLGKRLGTYEEITDFLMRFAVEEYWPCRSCKSKNWFEIDNQGYIHFWSY